MVDEMVSTRRWFLGAICAAVAPTAVIASAETPAMAARRRLAKLARESLSPAEIHALVAVESARAGAQHGQSGASVLKRLAREDFKAGRTIDLGGVRFARAEVAVFLSA